ncbi:hypothetical protein AAAQ13_03435 [Lactococcus lactis subsp. lactis]|uniref:hypothetical protein n=1 Tax=Lactococcus lactis TaxID=1358 RepID=UPI00311F6952
MRKLEKLLNDLTEKKVTNWKMHKRKKAFVAFAGVLAVGLGTAGLVYASAQSTSAKASLPTDTTVNWENNKPLYYEIDQTGKEHPKPMLKLADGTPAWCLGLGVPLPNNSTKAQLDATNGILNALTDEQIAVLNNVDYLAQKDGSELAYAQAQHATYARAEEFLKNKPNSTNDKKSKSETLDKVDPMIKNKSKSADTIKPSINKNVINEGNKNNSSASPIIAENAGKPKVLHGKNMPEGIKKPQQKKKEPWEKDNDNPFTQKIPDNPFVIK